MDGLMRVLVIALLVLAGSLSGCEEVRMQQLDADMGRMQQELAANEDEQKHLLDVITASKTSTEHFRYQLSGHRI